MKTSAPIETRSAARVWRALRGAFTLIVATLLALVFVRVLYTTRPGIALLDSVPEPVWEGLYGALGINVVGAEARSDADFLVLFPIGLILALLFLWGARALWRSRRKV